MIAMAASAADRRMTGEELVMFRSRSKTMLFVSLSLKNNPKASPTRSKLRPTDSCIEIVVDLGTVCPTAIKYLKIFVVDLDDSPQ